jgi:hypothetical protein
MPYNALINGLVLYTGVYQHLPNFLMIYNIEKRIEKHVSQ